MLALRSIATLLFGVLGLCAGGCGPQPPDFGSPPVELPISACAAGPGCMQLDTPEHACPEATMTRFSAEMWLPAPNVLWIQGGAFQELMQPLVDLNIVVYTERERIGAILDPALLEASAGSVFSVGIDLGGDGVSYVDYYLFFTCDGLAYRAPYRIAAS